MERLTEKHLSNLEQRAQSFLTQFAQEFGTRDTVSTEGPPDPAEVLAMIKEIRESREALKK